MYVDRFTHMCNHAPGFSPKFQFSKKKGPEQHKGNNSFVKFLKTFHSCSCTAWVCQQDNKLKICPAISVHHAPLIPTTEPVTKQLASKFKLV